MNNSELTSAIHLFLSDEKKPLSHSAIKDAYLLLQKKYADLKQSHVPSSSVSSPIITGDAMRIAYLLSRMPATFSVATTLMSTLADSIDPHEIESFLDLGTGTGAVLWAILNSTFSPLKITALDQDPQMIKMAKQLIQYSAESILHSTQWIQHDLTHPLEIQSHDLVTLSYALIEQTQLIPTLETIWPLFNKALIITEPGTPKGFSNILIARDYFIKKGAYIAAPCSHTSGCPMKNPNWCHFTKRLERSTWQQSLKGATLGYEDEAYSYLIITKFPIITKGNRILSSPAKRSGHVILDLCTPNTIQKETISRMQKQKYKMAKKKKWGDTWES